MLLRFATSTPGVHAVEVIEAFFDRGTLRDCADGKEIGKWENHGWTVGEKRFFRLDFTEPVVVHFDRDGPKPSRFHGPYNQFSLADGIVYAEGRVFAVYDNEHEDWYDHSEGRHFQAMIVQAVAASAPVPHAEA